MKKLTKTLLVENRTQQDDREIIHACLKGDAAAWEALIKRYQRLIYSIPLKSGLTTDEAADVFQSVCVKLLEKLSTIRDHDRLAAWLITTTSRECWRLSATRNRYPTISRGHDDEELDSLADLADSKSLVDEQRVAIEQQQAVRQAVAALPERCRELITMLFYRKDEMSYVEIAQRMKMPTSSVGPTRARCLEKLKKLLDRKI